MVPNLFWTITHFDAKLAVPDLLFTGKGMIALAGIVFLSLFLVNLFLLSMTGSLRLRGAINPAAALGIPCLHVLFAALVVFVCSVMIATIPGEDARGNPLR